jgi:hypothetical protein
MHDINIKNKKEQYETLILIEKLNKMNNINTKLMK